MNLSKKISVHRKFPTKRSVNLATVDQKPINPRVAVPGVLLIVTAAVFFGKFMVADRLAAVGSAQAEAAAVRAQLDTCYETMDDFGELVETYAHYTYSGMTEEELSRVDRVEVMELLQRVVLPQAKVAEWNMTGNQLDLPITGATLQEINGIVRQLEKEPLVDFCTVSTAATDGYGNSGMGDRNYDEVTAWVTVWLTSNTEEDLEQ